MVISVTRDAQMNVVEDVCGSHTSLMASPITGVNTNSIGIWINAKVTAKIWAINAGTKVFQKEKGKGWYRIVLVAELLHENRHTDAQDNDDIDHWDQTEEA